MTVSWRARAPWILAVAALLVGSVLVVVGAPADTSASFGWFAYQPLAAQAFFPQGGISLSLTSLIGLLVAASGLIVLSVWAGRSVGRRHDLTQPAARRRVRTAGWAAGAVIVIGAILAFSGWPAPQPLLTAHDSSIAFADGWSATSPHGLFLNGFLLAPATFVGSLLAVGGLALAAFLLGLSRARRRATVATSSPA